MRAQALSLRNKLLHFRLCTLFDTAIDPSLVSRELEPRINQIALPLLSVVDDPGLRAGIKAWLTRQHEGTVAALDRQIAATVVDLLLQTFADEAVASVPVRDIAAGINARLGAEAHRTTKQIARTIRRRLGIAIRKSAGIHVVPRTELHAITAAAVRLGISTDDAVGSHASEKNRT
jgi:hypothetical protein